MRNRLVEVGHDLAKTAPTRAPTIQQRKDEMTDDIFGLGPERVADLQDIERRRVWFDQEEAAATEQKRITAMRSELQEYLTRRGREYLDATAEEEVPSVVLEKYRADFLDEREAARVEHDAEVSRVQHSEVF
jgi:hypothetical protein